MPPALSGGAPVLAGPSARAAATAAIRPETPVSELISDSASIISASISASRTNSPPPSKVGAAPVRTTTKSQQRKQRKEALKKDTSTVAAQPTKPELEVEIAPIIGRKKKQKKEKEKEKPASRNATPTASRPETPLPTPVPAAAAKEDKESKEAKEVTKEETSTYRSTVNETMTLTDDTPVAKGRDGDLKGKNVDGTQFSDQGSTPRTLPTPAMVLQDLQKAGLVPANIDDLAFFKPTTWQTDKPRNELGGSAGNGTSKIDATPTKFITEDDTRSLISGNSVRKTIDGVRFLLTPNGDCLKNLTPEEEDRFLELQQRVAESAQNPAAFVSSRHEASSGFSLIKGRAVPNGPPSYFPPAPGMYPSDPANKIQREEAIYYINQYVLPRLNLNARDMNFPNSKSMAGLNLEARSAGLPATANLSSIAPWMYGPNAMPNDGDTAAPELNYPGPVGSFADSTGSNPALTSYLEGQAHQALNIPPAPGMDDISLLPPFPGSGSNKSNPTGLPGPFGTVPLMSYDDADHALSLTRKETDKLEKALNQLMRKNRRVLTMNGGGH